MFLWLINKFCVMTRKGKKKKKKQKKQPQKKER